VSTGKVYIFERVDDIWVESDSFSGGDSLPGDQFGFSLACLDLITVVGAPYHNADKGAVYIFKYNETEQDWVEMDKLENPDATENDALFGFSLSFDGTTLAVGAPQAKGAGATGQNRGEVYVYTYDEEAGNFKYDETLTHDDPANGNQFGYAVSVRNYTVAVGSPFETTVSGNAGSVLIYSSSDDDGTSETYSFQQQLIPNATAGKDELGSQVYLDYSRVVISAPVKNVDGFSANTGGAWVFDRNENDTADWIEGGFFTPDDLAGNDQFGSAMVVQANYLAIGSEFHNGGNGQDAGAVYAFFYNTTEETWEQVQKLVPDAVVANDRLGSAVGLYCDSLFLGASGDNGGSGVVYWYQRNEELARELASATECNDDPIPIRTCGWWEFWCDPYQCGWWEIFCWLWSWLFGTPKQPEPCPEVEEIFDPCV